MQEDEIRVESLRTDLDIVPEQIIIPLAWTLGIVLIAVHQRSCAESKY
jgi:hypothetical protein